MDLENAHLYENQLREKLKEKNPNHKALKKLYPSVWEAIKELSEALGKTKMYLKFYQKEREIFREEAQITLTNKEAKKIAYKLARHFKITLNGVYFKRGRYSFAYFRTNTLKLRNNPTILTICHELAHLYLYQRTKKAHHNKKLMRVIKRLVEYCRKKNYWISR